MTNPCRNCQARAIKRHGSCAAYAAWKAAEQRKADARAAYLRKETDYWLARKEGMRTWLCPTR